MNTSVVLPSLSVITAFSVPDLIRKLAFGLMVTLTTSPRFARAALDWISPFASFASLISMSLSASLTFTFSLAPSFVPAGSSNLPSLSTVTALPSTVTSWTP